MHFRNRFTWMIAVVVLVVPLSASAVVTTLNITAPSEAVPSATLQIFDLAEPENVVEERSVQSQGPLLLDLQEERAYGVRIKGGPVLVDRFESGDSVNVSIPLAFLKSALGWTVSLGFKGGYASQDVKGGLESNPALFDVSSESDMDGGTFMPDLEVMAPPCGELWGEPRLFFRLGGGVTTAKDSLASYSIDGVLETVLDVKYEGNWNLGAGVQLTTDVADHEVRFKPAVAYVQEFYQVSGRLQEFGEDYTNKKTSTLHIIRPELSIETPIVNEGSFELAALLFGGVNLNVGGGKENFRIDGMGGSIDYDFKARSVGYNVGLGFRLAWSPSSFR